MSESAKSVLDPISSWEQIIDEARRWIKEDIFCSSLKKGHKYWITEVNGEGQNATLRIQREVGEDTVMGFVMVKNFLERFEENGVLTTKRESHKVDVINKIAIVNLHRFLEFSDDSKFIQVRSEPKISVFGEELTGKKSIIERGKAAREIRQGAGEFRDRLLKAYGKKCCISGTEVVNTLDAAHIIPYAENPNNNCTNGLLLRADIHNLFDDGLIKIHPDSLEVRVAEKLLSTEYRKFNNQTLSPRIDGLRPDRESLEWHQNHT